MIALFFLVSILEAGAWYVLDEEACHEPNVYQIDDLLGWVYRPGAQKSTDCFGVTVSINEQGRLGPVISPQDNQERVLLMGDSLLAGLEIESSDRVAEILARKFKQNGRQVEVINDTVRGYGTDQIYLKFKHAVREFKPNYVIYFFSPDDAADTYINRFANENHLKKKYFEDIQGRLELSTQIAHDLPQEKNAWLQYSNIYKLFKNATDKYNYPHLPLYYQKKHRPIWEVTNKLILRMHRYAQRYKAKFILVSVPLREQIDTKYAKYFLRKHRLSRKDGLANINLFQQKSYDLLLPSIILKQLSVNNGFTYKDPRKYVIKAYSQLISGDTFWHDNHFALNSLGHRVMADYLYDEVFMGGSR